MVKGLIFNYSNARDWNVKDIYIEEIYIHLKRRCYNLYSVAKVIKEGDAELV